MNITGGIIPSAQKVLIYGPEGIGKSTFAAQFPEALFIDTEGSTKHMDVRRLDAPSSWTMLMEEVRYVYLNPHVCRTLVIDTADWAEQLCIAHVCAKAQKSGIEDFGYGKGYTYLAEEFGNLLNVLSEVVDAGVNVVMTAHSTIRKFEQPDETAAYDRWELKLGKKTAPLVKEWCDMVLFANYKTIVVKSEDKKAKGAGGQRVVYTSHRPTWDAKNRSGLPDEIAFDYAAIAAVIPSMPKPGEASVPTPVEAPKPEPAPAPLPATEVPAHLRALFDLMANEGVTEAEVRQAVFAKGHFPLATPIETYPADYVEGVLIGAWPKVLASIKDSRFTQANPDVPFK